MANHNRRLTALDDIDHAAGLQVFGDEFVYRSCFETIPAPKPVAGATNHRHHTARIIAVQTGGIFDAWGHAVIVRE